MLLYFLSLSLVDLFKRENVAVGLPSAPRNLEVTLGELFSDTVQLLVVFDGKFVAFVSG